MRGGRLLSIAVLAWAAWQPAAGATNPPAAAGRPRIAGLQTVGSTLIAVPGTWNGDPPLTYAYQWRRCNSAGYGCIDIAGATAGAYTVGRADVFSALRVDVTATNGAGSATSGSDATGVVPSPAVRTPATTVMAPWIRSAGIAHAGTAVRLRLSVCSSKGGTLYVTEWNRRGPAAIDKRTRSWTVAPHTGCRSVVRAWHPRLRPREPHLLAVRMRAGTLWSPALRLLLAR